MKKIRIMWPLKLTITLLIYTFLELQTQSCELDNMANGCRISNGACSCGYGCTAEYRYSTIDSCKSALKGILPDLCANSDRCLHGGTCTQVTYDPGFICKCDNTGYFGVRCEEPCPEFLNPHHQENMPTECITI